MEKITAAIKQVTQEGKNFRVYWSYSSDPSNDVSYPFENTATADDVRAKIQEHLDEIHKAQEQAESLKSLIGTEIGEK